MQSQMPRWVGWLLIAQLAVVCTIKLGTGTNEELLWLSHVALALAAFGALMRSAAMLSTAMVMVLVPHALWIVDCLAWLTTGSFPMGISSHISGQPWWIWLGTLHHFYLAPLLAVMLMRSRTFHSSALPSAILVFAVVSIISRLTLPEQANVNWTFRMPILAQAPGIAWVNGLPAPAYLLAINLWMAVVMFAPGAFVMRLIAMLWGAAARGRRAPHNIPSGCCVR